MRRRFLCNRRVDFSDIRSLKINLTRSRANDMAIFLIITEAIDDVYANTCLFTYNFRFLASIDVYIYIYTS